MCLYFWFVWWYCDISTESEEQYGIFLSVWVKIPLCLTYAWYLPRVKFDAAMRCWSYSLKHHALHGEHLGSEAQLHDLSIQHRNLSFSLCLSLMVVVSHLLSAEKREAGEEEHVPHSFTSASSQFLTNKVPLRCLPAQITLEFYLLWAFLKQERRIRAIVNKAARIPSLIHGMRWEIIAGDMTRY